jgi:hypothetical protein
MSEAKRYMSEWAFGSKVGKVDKEKGIIYDIAVVTPGEAKGHGVQLDSEFVETVVSQGNEIKGGVPMRFGHPTMSGNAIGTFMGKAKNFRVDDKGIARADAFLSNVAKDTPSGDLYTYVLNLSEEQPDAFGTSIVFKPGKKYVRNEDGSKNYASFGDEIPFVECDKFSKVDFVDDPAANPDGLFATAFSSETIAGQVSEFLDTHPQVWELLCDKPEIVDGFMQKYKTYRERFDACHINESEAVALADETASVDAEQIGDNKMEKELMQKINEEFGKDILADTMLNEGDYEYAKALKAEKDKADVVEQLSAANEKNESLSAQVVELQAKLDALSQGEEDTAEFKEAPEAPEEKPPVDINAEITARRTEGLSAAAAQNAVREQYPVEFDKHVQSLRGE